MDRAKLIKAFTEVAALAHLEVESKDLIIEVEASPHRPPRSLPTGKQVVYAFFLGDRCLKVGKAGPRSQARFTSQHYGRHAPSTLAKSILSQPEVVANLLTGEDRHRFKQSYNEISGIGVWMKENLTRVHFFLPTSAGPFSLSLLEAFVQCRFKPVYEGSASELTI